MLIFLLSLAGIPPLAGFFGKFYLFAAAVKAGGAGMGMLWLVIVGVAMSAVSLYYYLQPLKQIYVVEAPENAGKIEGSFSMWFALIGLAAAVIALGCAPDLLVEPLVSVGAGHGHQ